MFVCVNDAAAGAAAAVPETMSETLAIKALTYGMPGVRVDGADLFAVYAATAAAAERARAGGGPTFIEAVVSADSDPLDRLRLWLTSQKLIDDAALRKQVEAEIAAALDAEAKVGPPALHTMIEDVYSTPPRRWRKRCEQQTNTAPDLDVIRGLRRRRDVHVDGIGVDVHVHAWGGVDVVPRALRHDADDAHRGDVRAEQAACCTCRVATVPEPQQG